MDSQKKYKLETIVGGGIFILGLLLCCARAVEITSHKIVSAKILEIQQTDGECRRVSGKNEQCLAAKAKVEFPINREGTLKTGEVYLERYLPNLLVGSEIKVMFKARKPETVKIADISSGWKGPVGIFFIGCLILFVSAISKKKN